MYWISPEESPVKRLEGQGTKFQLIEKIPVVWPVSAWNAVRSMSSWWPLHVRH